MKLLLRQVVRSLGALNFNVQALVSNPHLCCLYTHSIRADTDTGCLSNEGENGPMIAKWQGIGEFSTHETTDGSYELLE